MGLALILEQALNGLQFGLMLFLLAAGLTLVFGIMDMINLAHGSLYMVGAYLTAAAAQASGSVALGLYGLIARTRLGMRVRAGASNREMATAMGSNVRALFTGVFAIGAALCALAGAMLGPLLAVQVGMGESILILAFVVIVIGGIGSIRGALIGSLLVGIIDTASRTVLPMAMRELFSTRVASDLGSALAALFGVGAYVVAILMQYGFASAWFTWPVAVLAAALLAAIIGAISLRTRGVYFIMITLAFAQMVYYLAVSLKVYGGDDGMTLAG